MFRPGASCFLGSAPGWKETFKGDDSESFCMSMGKEWISQGMKPLPTGAEKCPLKQEVPMGVFSADLIFILKVYYPHYTRELGICSYVWGKKFFREREDHIDVAE